MDDLWADAVVVTYAGVLRRLNDQLAKRPEHAKDFPAQHWFISQISDFFVKGTPVNSDILDFVVSMCDSGEAERYRGNHEIEAARLAEALKLEALERFGQGRDMLRLIKTRLRQEVGPPLLLQIHDRLGRPVFGEVSARYQGMYEWSLNFQPAQTYRANSSDAVASTESPVPSVGQLQIKFGPSAWFANTKGPDWDTKVESPDYSRLFISWKRAVHQSEVTLLDVAEGRAQDDPRLLDEIISIMNGP